MCAQAGRSTAFRLRLCEIYNVNAFVYFLVPSHQPSESFNHMLNNGKSALHAMKFLLHKLSDNMVPIAIELTVCMIRTHEQNQ